MKLRFMLWMMIFMLMTITITPTMAGEVKPGLKIEIDGKVQNYTARTVTVTVKEQAVVIGDMPAIILEGRTLVPLKEVFESEGIGAQVQWNHDRKEVTVTYNGNTIVVAINSNVAYVNGEKKPVDSENPKVVPKLIRDTSKQYAKTMVPLRFISETLGFNVGWNPDTYTAAISAPEPAPAPVPEPVPAPLPLPIPVPDPNYNTNIDKDLISNSNFILNANGNIRPLPTGLRQNPVIWTGSNPEAQITLSLPQIQSIVQPLEGEVVRVQAVKYSLEGNVPRFEISASGMISSVNAQAMDKRIVLDLTNTQNGLSQVTYSSNPVATGVRSSQFSTSPMTTRVVIDLKDNNERCYIRLSEDRKNLIVEFLPKAIHTIELAQSHLGDYIRVSGMAASEVKTFRLSNPDRVVMDFVGTQTSVGWREAQADGQFISGIRTDQFNATTTRVVALMNGLANYEVIRNGGETWIQFTAPSIRNFAYVSSSSNPLIQLNGLTGVINPFEVTVQDDYQSMTYTLTLPGDFTDLFGEGALNVFDHAVASVEFKRVMDGRTAIVIKQLDYYEYRLEQGSNGWQLKGYKPKELYSRVLVLDAGHGGTDPGAVSGGVQEKTLNLLINDYVKALFDLTGDFKVYYTRTSDLHRSLQYRTDLANAIGADLFVSIHNNAITTSTTKGIETLYMPGGSTQQLSSISAARIFHDELIAATGAVDRGLKPRDGLYVLRHTKMPAILLELGFVTNPEERARLSDPAYQQLLARTIVDAAGKVFERFPTGRQQVTY